MAEAPTSDAEPAGTEGKESKSKSDKAVEGDENLEGDETGGRKKMKRFQLPDLPKWWQAKLVEYAFTHPHVRARLEKLMGTNLVQLTDKNYMMEVEDRIRAVNDENLDKRVATRVLDEMERLKRLILIGKTPLKECPPELYRHPVFVFWRKVNKEVAEASKKRADNYYRKLKASFRIEQSLEEEVPPDEVEEPVMLTANQRLEKTRKQLEELRASDIEKGVRFTDEIFDMLQYQTNDVKTLQTLNTVEELYAMADKIIGNKRI